MSDDLLRDAARALGASASTQPAHPDETRARIMATLRRQRARRIGVIRAAIPLAAVLVGSIAWAAATGRLTASFRAIVPALGSHPSASEAAPPTALKPAARPAEVAAPIDPASINPASTAAAPAIDPAHLAGAPAIDPARPAGAPPPDLAPSPEVTPAGPAPTAPGVAAAVPTGARSITLGPTAAPGGKDTPASPSPAAQPAPIEPIAALPPGALPPGKPAPIQASTAAPPSPGSDPSSPPASSGASAAAPAAASPDEIALYQTAHRIHFVDRNPTAALAAWDTYLRAAPRGRFAVEAQYNRALCLVRVGRTAEAQKVLAGFARGAYGGYRQAEAQNLLDAMGSPAP